MEIRALTGFNEQTRKRYGRSYTPLNGMKSAGLGSPMNGFDFSFQDYINKTNNPQLPKQTVETVDTKTGKKKWFTIDNINGVLDLISRGFRIVTSIRKPDGSTAPVIPDYGTGSGSSGGNGGGGKPDKAGINITTVLGGAVAAYIVFSLLMSKK